MPKNIPTPLQSRRFPASSDALTSGSSSRPHLIPIQGGREVPTVQPIDTAKEDLLFKPLNAYEQNFVVEEFHFHGKSIRTIARALAPRRSESLVEEALRDFERLRYAEMFASVRRAA